MGTSVVRMVHKHISARHLRRSAERERTACAHPLPNSDYHGHNRYGAHREISGTTQQSTHSHTHIHTLYSAGLYLKLPCYYSVAGSCLVAISTSRRISGYVQLTRGPEGPSVHGENSSTLRPTHGLLRDFPKRRQNNSQSTKTPM